MFLSRRVLHAIARKWTSVTHTTHDKHGAGTVSRLAAPRLALPRITLPRMCIACSLASLGVCLAIYLAHTPMVYTPHVYLSRSWPAHLNTLCPVIEWLNLRSVNADYRAQDYPRLIVGISLSIHIFKYIMHTFLSSLIESIKCDHPAAIALSRVCTRRTLRQWLTWFFV